MIAVFLFVVTVTAFCESTVWDCQECGKTGNTRKYCGGCGKPAPWLENNEEASIPNDASTEELVALGVSYYEGKGAIQDYTKAVEYFQRASDQGNAEAQNYMGMCCQNGLGTEKDEQSAKKYFQLAASQGNEKAQYNLGYCYEHGIGVKKDYVKAYRWYKTANSNGYSDEEELNAIRDFYLAQKYKNQYYADGKLKAEYLFDAATGNVSRLNRYNRYGEISNYEIYNQWDSDGNVLQEIDFYPRNSGKYRETTYLYSYDDVGNCITWSTTYKDGSTGEKGIKTYDINGNCLTSKSFDPDGSTTSNYVYTYDESDHISSRISLSPEGNKVTTDCDYHYSGDHCTAYTVLNANDQVERYYQAIWQDDILVKRTEVDTSGNEIESWTYDLFYGDVLSAKYSDDTGNRYEQHYIYGADSFEEDFRSLSYGNRTVTTYNTKEERLREESYTLDSSSQTWVYESTAKYSLNAKKQTEIERQYADKSKFIRILDDNGMTVLSKSYKADGSLWYAYSYEYNEKGQEIRQNSLDENGRMGNYTIFEYDAKGNRSKEMTYKADGTYYYGHSYVYNENGQIIRSDNLDENGETDEYTISEYDTQGNKIKTLTYKADGTYYNGHAYVYNEKGQRIRDNKLTEDGNIESYSVSEYDEDGNKTLEIDYGSNGLKKSEIRYRKKDGVRQWKWIYYNSDGTIEKEREWENY